MAASDVNEIYLSSSPHFTEGTTTSTVMSAVVIALLPLCVYGVMLFGMHALVTILVSVVTCVVGEAVFQKLAKLPVTIKDGSAVVTGLLLALVLPPTLPVWQTVVGAIFAIVVAKAFFGGLGQNVWNPALTGRAFLFVSFPASMGAAWLLPKTDAITGATTLSSLKASTFFADANTYMEYFMGNRAGCIGETSIFLIVLAFAFLAVTNIIDWRAPLTFVGTVVLLTLVSGGDAVMALLSGGLLFGATFMVTDYATTPVTKRGRLVFGLGCGVITFLIRKFSGYPEGVMFSILFMNSLSSFLNRLIGRKYGYKKGGAK